LKFPERIDKIIPRVLRNLNMDERMKNWQVVEKWAEIVGDRIAEHTRATGVDAENLFVEVDNPMWQSQLFLMKESIVKKIKKYSVTIRDIKFHIVSSSRNTEENV
jgi:predicted nucleic acid-binding Zn ribbon protein